MDDYVVKLTLDINCAKTPPVVNAAQFDKGRKIEITITANGDPYDVTDCTAILKGVRKNKTHFALACEITDNKVIATTDADTLSVGGVTVAKIVLSDSTHTYSTQVFIIDADDALEGDITKDNNYSILIDLINQVKSDYVLTDEDKSEIVDTLKAEVPLVKTAEQPTFANSVDECTDTSKVYVLPDGYFYGYREVTNENYNLLKLSEISYSSRLQNDVEGITSSTTANLVTGWIPVQYGKYYTPSIVIDGVRQAYMTSSYSLIVRINLKLDDGTIVVYHSTLNTDENSILQCLVASRSNETIKIPYENAVAMMVQITMTGYDISTAEKFEAYEPMIIESATDTEVYDKLSTYEYISGDVETESILEWYNTGLAYNQPVDYEDRVIELEADVSTLKNDVDELEANIANPTSASPYYRDINFGVLPFAYYHGLAESYENEGFSRTTQYADFITLWKSLVANHSGYVTETELGSASDGQMIYLYDFKPVRISNQNKPIPKIIIIAGQHGSERCNIFGLYYFVSDLLNKWNQHPSLEYLRNHVELMIVPVVNTYGFDTLSYKNANEVNTNRNYDSNWELVEDTTSLQYGGTEPFDQPESQIIRDLILNNNDALLVIDSHTCWSGLADSFEGLTYYGICTNTDAYYNRMLDVVAHQLAAVSANYNLEYDLGQPDVIMGYLTHGQKGGLLRSWVSDNGCIGVLVEGHSGFPNDASSHTGRAYKANEEQMVNYLITALNYLSK